MKNIAIEITKQALEHQLIKPMADLYLNEEDEENEDED